MKAIHFSLTFLSVGAFALGSCLSIFAASQAAGSGALKPAVAGGAQSGMPGEDLSEMKLPPSEMQGLIMRYGVNRSTLSRLYPADQSPARQSRFKQFYTQWQEALARLDFDALSQEDKIDYLLFKNHLDYELRQMEIQARNAAEAAPLVPFAQTIIDLEEARRRMEKVDSQKAAA
jgi:hypothetical protein